MYGRRIRWPTFRQAASIFIHTGAPNRLAADLQLHTPLLLNEKCVLPAVTTWCLRTYPEDIAAVYPLWCIARLSNPPHTWTSSIRQPFPRLPTDEFVPFYHFVPPPPPPLSQIYVPCLRSISEDQ